MIYDAILANSARTVADHYVIDFWFMIELSCKFSSCSFDEFIIKFVFNEVDSAATKAATHE